MQFGKSVYLVAIMSSALSAHAVDLGHIAISNPPTGKGGTFGGFLNGFGPVGGFAGLLNFSEVDLTNPANSLGQIVGFCGDVTASFPPPNNWDVNIYDPASLFGNANVTAAGNMVANVANALGGNLTLLTDRQAFALQIDVWEAIYDGPSELLPDFLGGTFSVTGEAIPNGTLTPLSAATIADADAFWAFRNVSAPAVFLDAEGNNGLPPFGQNLLTVRGGGTHIFTPEPVTSSLSIAAVCMFVRRRKKQKSS